MKKKKQPPSYQIFINSEGQLFYEDKFSIALIDGIITGKESKKHIEVKFGSNYITQKIAK